MNYQDVKENLYSMYKSNPAMFNMAAIYLIDVGIRNIDKVDIEKVRQQAEEKEKEIEAKGGFSFFSVDCQCKMVAVAKEIAENLTEPTDLLTFANDKMDFCTGSPSKEDYKQYAQELYWMAQEENIMDYDADNWKEHVAEYLNIEVEDVDNILE